MAWSIFKDSSRDYKDWEIKYGLESPLGLLRPKHPEASDEELQFIAQSLETTLGVRERYWSHVPGAPPPARWSVRGAPAGAVPSAVHLPGVPLPCVTSPTT